MWTHSDLWEAVGKEIARSINSWTDQIDSKAGREQGADERGLSCNNDNGKDLSEEDHARGPELQGSWRERSARAVISNVCSPGPGARPWVIS